VGLDEQLHCCGVWQQRALQAAIRAGDSKCLQDMQDMQDIMTGSYDMDARVCGSSGQFAASQDSE
jgi:hypothetical protein